METKTEQKKERTNDGDAKAAMPSKAQYAYGASLVKAGFAERLPREDWMALTKEQMSAFIGKAVSAQRRA